MIDFSDLMDKSPEFDLTTLNALQDDYDLILINPKAMEYHGRGFFSIISRGLEEFPMAVGLEILPFYLHSGSWYPVTGGSIGMHAFIQFHDLGFYHIYPVLRFAWYRMGDNPTPDLALTGNAVDLLLHYPIRILPKWGLQLEAGTGISSITIRDGKGKIDTHFQEWNLIMSIQIFYIIHRRLELIAGPDASNLNDSRGNTFQVCWKTGVIYRLY